MFDDILSMVKDHFANNPELAAAIPAGQENAVHEAIANHIADTQAAGNTEAPQQSSGGMFSSMLGGLTSGSPIGSAVEGGVVGMLSEKFGFSPAVTGAIAAALPVLINKYAN